MFNKNLFLFLFILLLLFSFVRADKIIETKTNVNGLQLFFPDCYTYLPQNTDYEINIHVSNISNGYPLTNIETDCYLHLYNSTGQHTIESNLLTKDVNGWDHQLIIKGDNLSDVGTHSIYIWCNYTSSLGGEVRSSFIITESGFEITEGRSIFAIGLLFILICLMFISLYGTFKIENPSGKFALYWITHLFAILICFVGWQFGVEGLLDGTGIVAIFRILFYVLTVAVFPMIILSIAWIFYIHTVNDDIRNMMDKGMPPEEAFKRSTSRRYF